jgi:hypothetical protein
MRQDQSNKSALKAPKTKTIFEIGAMIENLDSSTKASIGFDVSCPIDSSSYSLQPTALRHEVQKSHQDQRSNDLSHELFTGQIISRNKRRKVLQRSRRRKVVIAKDHRNEGSLVASAHASEPRQVRPRRSRESTSSQYNNVDKRNRYCIQNKLTKILTRIINQEQKIEILM